MSAESTRRLENWSRYIAVAIGAVSAAVATPLWLGAHRCLHAEPDPLLIDVRRLGAQALEFTRHRLELRLLAIKSGIVHGARRAL